MDAYELRKKRDLAPYNDSMQGACTIYDYLNYTMDVDLCPKENHKLISGNVIKSFRCITLESTIVPTNNN